MNKLQIISEIFGSCFTPCVRVVGHREYYSAISNLHIFNQWSSVYVSIVMQECKEKGISVGVDFDRKEFTLTFNK